MDTKTKQDLLAYYWNREPVYHPTKGAPMPRKTIFKMRLLAFVLFFGYLVFSRTLLLSISNTPAVFWVIGVLLGAFCADLISGLIHMYIDFGISNRKNPIHKELFLSRVHHHQLDRPAKLNYASLWFSPALYSFLVLALLPALLVTILSPIPNLNWLAPFWLSVLWFSSVSQVFHAFAHGKAKHPFAKKIIRLLQKFRLMIPPKIHGKHHSEIDCNFSVLNGWSIPLLNFVFRNWIESRLSGSTTPARQKADMKRKLSYPYEEIL